MCLATDKELRMSGWGLTFLSNSVGNKRWNAVLFILQ